MFQKKYVLFLLWFLNYPGTQHLQVQHHLIWRNIILDMFPTVHTP